MAKLNSNQLEARKIIIAQMVKDHGQAKAEAWLKSKLAVINAMAAQVRR